MKIDLILGDCLEKMRDIPDGSIDLTVTSPPYDNLRTYNGNIDQWNEKKWQGIIQELFRVTKQGGVVVWVVGDATIKGSETGTSFKQALWAKECGFNLHDTMIWCKDTVAFPTPARYYQAFEYMFIFSKGKPTFNQINDRKNKTAGSSVHGTDRGINGETKPKSAIKLNLNKVVKEYGSRFNYWLQNTEKMSKIYGHPATFPEKLAYDHILSWSNEGDTVLDTFMGSGTTGVACKNLNRNFIGIEIEPEYMKMAEQRLKLKEILSNIK